MKLTSLSPSDFQRLAATTRLRPAQVALARSVLVSGLSVGETAERAGVSKQQVSRAAERIRQAYGERREGAQRAKVLVSVEVAPSIAQAIQAVASALAAAKGTDQARVGALAADGLMSLATQLREAQQR